MESAVLEAYEKLITVTINGKPYEVPENNTLLRVLQFMNLELAYSKYCWNGDCRNCVFRYVSRKSRNEVDALGCQMRLFQNMVIKWLAEGVQRNSGGGLGRAAAGHRPPPQFSWTPSGR